MSFNYIYSSVPLRASTAGTKPPLPAMGICKWPATSLQSSPPIPSKKRKFCMAIPIEKPSMGDCEWGLVRPISWSSSPCFCHSCCPTSPSQGCACDRSSRWTAPSFFLSRWLGRAQPTIMRARQFYRYASTSRMSEWPKRVWNLISSLCKNAAGIIWWVGQ